MDVKALPERTSRAYGHARIRFDPWQMQGSAQRLRDRGLTVEEWIFSAQSVGRLGQSLHLLLRDHRLALPDDRELLDELATVRLRESAPGVYRLDHDAGQHDDRAVALGLAALALTERGEGGCGWASFAAEMAARISRSGAASVSASNPYGAAHIRGVGADVAAAVRAQTPAQRRVGLGLVLRGSANDPSVR